MCFARWTFAEGAQCLLCSFFAFCKCCSNTCPQEAFGSSTQPEFVRRQLAIAVAIGQSGHGIDSADADADAAEDDDGNGDNDSEDDNDKFFP